MNITPHLGIGDLLIIKMKQISNNLNIVCININRNLLLTYCENYELKIYSVTNLIKFLFPNTTIYVNNNPCDFNIFDNYSLKKTYLYHCINENIMNNIKNEYSDYIVFHTKMRHDGLIDKFTNEILPGLNIFFENLKTSKKIIILGERNIGQNLETKIHKTISLYNNLLLLNKNNDIIDLSNDILTCGNPDFNKFLLEIEIINKSLCNITFGIGGPFNICKAFSKNNVSFIPFYHLSPFKNNLELYNAIDNTIVQNIEDLNNRICKFTIER
jgi:hypothetical protein